MSMLLILQTHKALPMTGSIQITKVDNHDDPYQNSLL